jgi:rhamnogalacturonan endolyase
MIRSAILLLLAAAGAHAQERARERLDRGLVALPRGGGKVYVGWRLLETDPADAAFNVYRSAAGGAPQKLNAEPVRKTTDFVDESAPAGGPCSYAVRAVTGTGEGAPSPAVTVQPGAAQDYVGFRLDDNLRFQKVGLADLDGDGRYDFVLKHPDENVDPYEKYWKQSTSTFKVEARLHDGRPLWVRDLGWSIERGMWYAPMVAADLDGDGKAEVALKTGEGDPRDPDGRVTSGPEWVSVWDGRTGKDLARAPWPPREVGGQSLGYNYYCRNQLTVAYLDGKTPSLIVQRGTYTIIQLAAWQYRAGELKKIWEWNTETEAEPKKWRGQGAHALQAHDVDGDGRDEIVLGSAVIDDNGKGLWTTGLGHPDHCYVGEIDPSHPGLEIFYGMESRQKEANGLCVADAKTGTILWGHKGATRHIHGFGLCGDIDPRHPGSEVYGFDTDAQKDFAKAWLYSAKGALIEEFDKPPKFSRPVYWDADPYRELVCGGRIEKYRGDVVLPKLVGRVALIADVLGDWREELVVTQPGELRIYTTAIPAADRRVCLMQDRVYRATVLAAAQGYFYNPMLSYLPSAGK